MSDAVPDMLTRLRSSHVARDLDPATLPLWSTHIAATVAVLQEVTRDLREAGNLAPFQKSGWWRRKKRRNAGGSFVRVPDEDAISDALVERVKQLQSARPQASAIAAYRDLAVGSQQRRRKQSGIGPQGRKNTDLIFYRTGEIHLDLRIEAKILFSIDDLKNEYCSERGLLRYSDAENPYTVEIVGGMVAYCVSHNLETWIDEIESSLASVPCVSEVGRVSFCAEAPNLLCCEISRNGAALPSVVVFHLGLEFDTDPPSRP